MKLSLRALTEKLALVSVTAILSSAIVLHQQDKPSDPQTQQALKAQSLELVDENGRTCVMLKAGPNGGSFQLLSPDKGEGQKGTIAYLGSVFGNDLQFLLKEPRAGGKSAFSVHISGEPSYPSVSGLGVNGTSAFRLGAIGNESPMLSLWHLNEKEPYFAK